MTTRARRTKPAPQEELIGTITANGMRLTRETWRAQRAYRSEQERAEKAPRRGLLSWLAALSSNPHGTPLDPTDDRYLSTGGVRVIE